MSPGQGWTLPSGCVKQQHHNHNLINTLCCQDLQILCSFDGQNQRSGFYCDMVDWGFIPPQNQDKTRIFVTVTSSTLEEASSQKIVQPWSESVMREENLIWNEMLISKVSPPSPALIYYKAKKKRSKTLLCSLSWHREAKFRRWTAL